VPKSTNGRPNHVATATESIAPTRRPAPYTPTKCAPAVIRAGEVSSLAELRRRPGWAEHSVRQARVAGLRLITFGRQKYCLGEDVLSFSGEAMGTCTKSAQSAYSSRIPTKMAYSVGRFQFETAKIGLRIGRELPEN
jgi:hypothetical protein